MGETLVADRKERLLSLDVFRGITIALMVLVNNPGSWGAIYHPFEHAPWDGFTPTDFVFPFFLFIVGVAMTFSFDRRVREGANKLRLFEQVARRAIILFLLGLILQGFPNMRLIGPYILFIAALGLLFADEPPFSFGRLSQPALARKLIGLAIAGTAIAWFVFDLAHFSGKVVATTWSDIWPTSNAPAFKDAAGADITARYLRVPGVLQRIALAYFFGSIIALICTCTHRRIAWLVVILFAYWGVCQFDFIAQKAGWMIGAGGGERDAPMDAPYPGLLHDWIDVKLLGKHLYSSRPDPEGLISTLGGIGTVLCGMLAGTWLRREDLTKEQKCLGMFYAACLLVTAGMFWNYAFPINKKIWTSSYVLAMAGFALFFLAFCMYLLDIRGKTKWSWPFVVLGTNAIYVFFASGILGRLLGMMAWPKEGGAAVWNVRSWFYENVILNPIYGLFSVDATTAGMGHKKLASFLFAAFYVVLWVGLTYPLYRKKWFLKI